MTPVAAVRPDPQPRAPFAERAKLDQAGVARAAEVLGVLLDAGESEALDLRDMAARVVAAYALGTTKAAIDAHRASSRGPRRTA